MCLISTECLACRPLGECSRAHFARLCVADKITPRTNGTHICPLYAVMASPQHGCCTESAQRACAQRDRTPSPPDSLDRPVHGVENNYRDWNSVIVLSVIVHPVRVCIVRGERGARCTTLGPILAGSLAGAAGSQADLQRRHEN